MAKAQALSITKPSDLAMNAALVVGASLFVALCARLSVPLPFTPVPLTLSNFAVLLVGLVLGPVRGAAALTLYLAQGAAGLPVFSPAGPGGAAQLLGATGGYLMAYPAVAYVAGWIGQRAKQSSFARNLLACTAAEALLFTSGISWLVVMGFPLPQAAAFGLYPFFFAEVIKVMAASSVALRVSVRRQ